MKDIDEKRRENLRRIEEECGGASAAARIIGMSPSQFLNLMIGAKDSKTGKPRGMRKETARRIETAMNKPVGWLDEDHSQAYLGMPEKPLSVICEVVSEPQQIQYSSSQRGTRAAIELLLIPAEQRTGMSAEAQAAIKFIENVAIEEMARRKSAA